MPSKTKTIKINPVDFQMSSKKGNAKKTSKKRDGGDIVKPNKIKKKLLERIKQHSRNTNKTGSDGGEAKQPASSSYKDEFYDSIGYLTKLAEEKQTTSPYRKTSINKTTKKYDTQTPPHIQVDLDLPEDLKEQSVSNTNPSSASSISLNPPSNNVSPPYGCLKGGSKPTFRAWNKTQKTYITNVQPAVTMPFQSTPQPPSTNEQRLAKLKETFKQRHNQIATPVTSSTEIIPAPPVLTPIVTEPETIPIPDVNPIPITSPIISSNIGGNFKAFQEEQKVLSSIRLPKKTKKTTTRKYGLGKNNKKRVIGVLIKDRQTRKKILDAQKDIRRKSLVDVKKYLNDHGLIKAGSRAPTDVVRKIYESSVMSGEITNADDEIMAHNFMNAS